MLSFLISILKSLSILLVGPLLFASCSAVDSTTSAIAGLTPTTLWPSRVDVVEVREGELKEMPLGKEMALAFDQKRKRSLWSFALPEFVEPQLPEIEGEAAGFSLLPPKSL